MHNEEKNVPVTEAAKLLGVSPMFVRIALREGKAPFGFAVRITGEQYTYHISPHKLKQYLGDINYDNQKES